MGLDQVDQVPTLEGRVALRGVGFHYPGPIEVPILKDLTMDVEPGTTVALVGRSGSGKTTFVKCLAGLLEPTAGTILYDGVDLRTIEYRDLRRHIGFVLQDSYVFDDTIARNIAFGDDEPDMERDLGRPARQRPRVRWAAAAGLRDQGGRERSAAVRRPEAANRDRPRRLQPPAGADTRRGHELARHRIRPRREGEHGPPARAAPSFVIAHRLSTVREANLIVVLEQDKIVEQGSHDELIGRQGLYYYLVSQQLEA